MHDPSGYLKRPQASGLRSHPNWLHRCWRSTNKASNTCLGSADTSNCCAANWSSLHLIEVTWEGCDNVASRAPCKLLETVKSVSKDVFSNRSVKKHARRKNIISPSTPDQKPSTFVNRRLWRFHHSTGATPKPHEAFFETRRNYQNSRFNALKYQPKPKKPWETSVG